MRVDHEGRSDVGRRSNNEDGLLALPELRLFAVADGMGGYEGGEVASRVALASLQSYFELLGEEGLGLHLGEEIAKERFVRAIRVAHREVQRRAVGDLAQMGTTLACLAIQGDRVLIAHVGDSRVYRLREGDLAQLTRDHSLYAQLEASGYPRLPSRRSFRLSNVITQALGQGSSVEPDVRVEEVMPGDRFVLATDGLTDVLDEETIGWHLTRSRGSAQALVEAAFQGGSQDNITALVVSIS